MNFTLRNMTQQSTCAISSGFLAFCPFILQFECCFIFIFNNLTNFDLQYLTLALTLPEVKLEEDSWQLVSSSIRNRNISNTHTLPPAWYLYRCKCWLVYLLLYCCIAYPSLEVTQLSDIRVGHSQSQSQICLRPVEDKQYIVRCRLSTNERTLS